ncbi:MAG: NDP-hexose 2,3-dehydratase family protein [Kiritimatiellae bacterium]|nr:NDP-hexose 2,3-dehydratase family protein [Kiritimatiellia bacterium]
MKESSFRFLKSALQEEGFCISTPKVLEWLQTRNREVKVRLEWMRLSEMADWACDGVAGNIRHASGSFFSIEGIHVATDCGKCREWEQPIINQPEIGFLGCIVKEFRGVLHFLVQAKIEPGNINNVQLSPTLQATRSNYSRVHRGRRPEYLEYFNGERPRHVLLDQLQSEQGARFLHKRNRNIIVEVEEDIELSPDFAWLTLGQIKRLAQRNNVVNMDLRTVIAGISFGNGDAGILEIMERMGGGGHYAGGMLRSALDSRGGIHSIDEIISWFTEQKTKHSLSVLPKGLQQVEHWVSDDWGVRHENGLYFDIRYLAVFIGNREVNSWQQPIVAAKQEGILAFIVKRIGGVYHFLVQAKLECGNFDVLEFAPTVQCVTGNYQNSRSSVPYLDYVLSTPRERLRLDVLQSEEGGRFYREQNRNLIVEADGDFPETCPENFCWMTLNQLLTFIRYNNYLNIQARSLLAAIRFANFPE